MLSLCCPCAEKVPLIFWIPQQIHLFIFFVLGKMALEFNKDLFHIFRKTLNFFSPWFIICRLDLVSMPRGFKAIVLLSLELELLTIWQLADYIKEMSRVFKVGCDDICLYACNSNVFFFLYFLVLTCIFHFLSNFLPILKWDAYIESRSPSPWNINIYFRWRVDILGFALSFATKYSGYILNAVK